MSRPRRSKADTCALIAAGARRLFLQGRYADVTTREIALAAGVSWATVRTYYPDPADVWRDAMGCPPPDVAGAVARALAAAPAGHLAASDREVLSGPTTAATCRRAA